MAQVERDLWWYRALHALVLTEIRRHPARQDAEIVDAGCGTGGLMLCLRDAGYSRLRGFDLSEDAVQTCRERGLEVERDHLLNLGERYAPDSADVIVSNDTLYFLNEGERATFIAACGRVVRPGGILILNLPALKVFSGLHDVSVGIGQRFGFGRVQRHAQSGQRFEKRDVGRMFANAELDVVSELFWPFLLSPMIFAARLGQRIRMRLQPGLTVRSDVDLPPKWLNEFLFGLTQFENRRFAVKPFGSSLFVVARKQ